MQAKETTAPQNIGKEFTQTLFVMGWQQGQSSIQSKLRNALFIDSSLYITSSLEDDPLSFVKVCVFHTVFSFYDADATTPSHVGPDSQEGAAE